MCSITRSKLRKNTKNQNYQKFKYQIFLVKNIMLLEQNNDEFHVMENQ